MSSNLDLSALHGRRILITGAAGQLGRYLVPATRVAGAVAIAAGSTRGPGVDLSADLADDAAASRLIDQAEPEIIIHAAACTDVDGIEREPQRGELGNARASRNVAAAARQAGAYLIAVSTDMVFAGDGGAPYGEADQTGPISAYGASKLAAEQAVLEADAAFAVARTAWLYGGAGKHFPRTVLMVLRDRGGIDVVDDECGSPTFAGDLAAALLGVAAGRGAGVFHLANAGRASRLELARKTARLAGLAPQLVRPISTAAFLERYPLPARRPADSTLRNTRAAALGVTLRDWQTALAGYVPMLAGEMGIGSNEERG